jgi:hypothetical protein
MRAKALSTYGGAHNGNVGRQCVASIVVIAGLDPAIHGDSQHGCAGHARA